LTTFASKVANFQLPYPTCIWRLRWGWPLEFCSEICGIRKLESLGNVGVVYVILHLAVSVEHPLVTDGRTDKQTHDNS